MTVEYSNAQARCIKAFQRNNIPWDIALDGKDDDYYTELALFWEERYYEAERPRIDWLTIRDAKKVIDAVAAPLGATCAASEGTRAFQRSLNAYHGGYSE